MIVDNVVINKAIIGSNKMLGSSGNRIINSSIINPKMF